VSSAALLLDGLTPGKLIAVGESQSAGRLVTYINAIQPRDHEYDGFLVHSRGAAGAPLRQLAPGTPAPATANDAVPAGTKFRGDLDVPVLLFQTETDVFNSNASVRQPDTSRFRSWEVAGSSHFDWYGLAIGPGDTGDGQGAVQNLAAELSPSNLTSAGNVRRLSAWVDGLCRLALSSGAAGGSVGVLLRTLAAAAATRRGCGEGPEFFVACSRGPFSRAGAQ
jgi:Alpha/beta hydrolase domain